MANKAVLFVFAGLTLLAVVGGTTFSVLKYQEHVASQKALVKASAAVNVAANNLADAQDFYDYAESVASSAYIDYIYCYYWCYDELSYYLSVSSTASEASVLVDSASSSLATARSLQKQAEILTEKTAAAFNQTTLWSGIGVGGLLITTLVLLASVRRRASQTSGESGADPLNLMSNVFDNAPPRSGSGWTCRVCAKENVGGLFCVDCGSKIQPVSDSVDSPRS